MIHVQFVFFEATSKKRRIDFLKIGNGKNCVFGHTRYEFPNQCVCLGICFTVVTIHLAFSFFETGDGGAIYTQVMVV